MPYQNPFALPKTVMPEFDRALNYWRHLKRGGNNLPFADDVNLTLLPGVQAFLIKVFASPLRFRIELLSEDMRAMSKPIVGKFLDEIAASDSLDYLLAQCCATVEAREPTFCHLTADGSNRDFSRLLLPTWGDGHTDMLLGVLAIE